MTGCSHMPLVGLVVFEARLQRGNRFQLPKLIRWRYKLESKQALKVTVHAVHFFGSYVTFYARMDKSGRMTIPRLARDELVNREEDRKRLTGAVLEVRLEPA